MPAARPNHAEPVSAATAPALIAAISILPSSPMSKIPARSEYNPASPASSNGVPRRRVEAKICIRVS